MFRKMKSLVTASFIVMVIAEAQGVTKQHFDSAVYGTSRKCSVTFFNCVSHYTNMKIDYDHNNFCDMFTNTTNIKVHPFFCMVSNGLCTEDEFDNLVYVACGSVMTDFLVSDYKAHFYASIDTTSAKCQEGVLACINISMVATVVKQEEEFCMLMNINIKGINSETCLLGYCSQAEWVTIKDAACNFFVWTEESFSDALLYTSGQCQAAMEDCAVSTVVPDAAVNQIRSRQYCDVINMKDGGVTTEKCLVSTDKCTAEEFTMLEYYACRNQRALTSITPLCEKTIISCALLSPFAKYSFELQNYCQLFKMEFNGVSAYQCLVDVGLCTASEYYMLYENLCDDPSAKAALSETILYEKLKSTSHDCQFNMLGCIMGSIIATMLKIDGQYCQIMTFSTNGRSADECLDKCTRVEIEKIRFAACNTSLSLVQPSPFTNSVMSTYQRCKDTIEQCAFGSSLAFSSIQSGQYCQLMNVYQSGGETYACLVGSGGCTDSEYEAMTNVACDTE